MRASRKGYRARGRLALLSGPLSAHDADHPSGRIGDHELKNVNGVPCCGASDCAEFQDDAVTETHAGYVVDGWGYYHPHASLRWTVGHWESADAGGHWDWIKDYVLKTGPCRARTITTGAASLRRSARASWCRPEISDSPWRFAGKHSTRQ